MVADSTYGSVSYMQQNKDIYGSYISYPSTGYQHQDLWDCNIDEDTPLVGSRRNTFDESPSSPRSSRDFPTAKNFKNLFRKAVSSMNLPILKNDAVLPEGVTVAITYNLDSEDPKVCHVQCSPTSLGS